MWSENSVHSGTTDVRSFFSKMRACFSTLTCGCFGRRVRSYQVPNPPDLSNLASPQYGLPLSDRSESVFGRMGTLHGKQMRIETNPSYQTISHGTPTSGRQPYPSQTTDLQALTVNVNEDSYSSGTAHQVFMPDAPLDCSFHNRLGQPSPDDASQAQNRYRPANLMLRQRNSADFPAGTCSLSSSGQSTPVTSASNSAPAKRLLVMQRVPVAQAGGSKSPPTSPTQPLYVNTSFQSHSSCPTTPAISWPVQSGSGDLDLALLQANPNAKYSMSSLLSQVELEKTFSKPELVRMFSLHDDIVVGAGKFTEEMGGVVETRYIPGDFLCVAKPLENSPSGHNEIRVLSKIRHHNIANLVGTFFDDSGQLYVAMENGGKNLKVLIEGSQGDRSLGPENIKMILAQLLIVTDYLTEEGIIHSDLKLDNVLYQDGCVKVCDFGLARGLGEEPPLPVLVLPYMPLETLILKDNRPSINPRAEKVDIWSIGCILAELITRQKLIPLNDNHIQLIAMNDKIIRSGITYEIDSAAKEIKNVLGDDISKLFTDMMQIDPDHRITASEALQRPCIVELIKNLPKAPDIPSSVNMLAQHIPLVNQHLQYQYAGLTSAGGSPDSGSVLSIAENESQPGMVPPRVRHLITLEEVETPKTGQSDKNASQFTFDNPNPVPKSARRDTTHSIPTLRQVPEPAPALVYLELQYASSEDHIDEGNAA